MPSWQEPGEISPAMAKPARPFARCLIGADCSSSSSSSGKALLQTSHVLLASLAGSGGDEPGMPGQLPAGSGAGGWHSGRDEDGAGRVHTSVPESPSLGGGGFEACAGRVKTSSNAPRPSACHEAAALETTYS